MKKLETLFDFQKIQENKHMKKIIDEVEMKYGMNGEVDELDDDSLSAVAGGGMEPVIRSDEVKSYCPNCSKMTMFRLSSGGRAFCKECGEEKEL